MRNSAFVMIPVVLVAAAVWSASSRAEADQCPDEAIEPGVLYDARPFLTNTQKNSFEDLYPKFDEEPLQKDWEWKDVDPLALFTPAENRARRRERFLFEYTPKQMRPSADRATSTQLSFKQLIQAEIPGAEVLLDLRSVKIISPYSEGYELDFPACNLFEKLAELGLRWAKVGGQNLYIYNGSIYLGSFKAGWLMIADHNIDNPPIQLRSTQPGALEPPGSKSAYEDEPI